MTGKKTKAKAERPNGLPSFLKPYCWDAEFARVDRIRHQFYLIERILEYGDDRAIHWLRETYSPSEIARVVRSSRAISLRCENSDGLPAFQFGQVECIL